MSEFDRYPELPLSQAIIAWCDQGTVDDLFRAQSFFTEVQLRESGYFPFSDAQKFQRDLTDIDRDELAYRTKLLRHAWDKLLENFRCRVQDSLLYLRGVQVGPERHVLPSLIPNGWGHDLEFDLFKDEVRVARDRHRYIGVIVSKSPPAAQLTQPSATPPTPAVTLESIVDLSDEVILALLEEHAKRVVENDSRLIQPGKISLMPIIGRKMEHRAKMGLTRETMSAEAVELAEWIAQRCPSFQTPKASTIENVLGKAYRKPQS